MTSRRPVTARRPIRLALVLVLMLPAAAAWTPVASAQDPVIAAAGDVACDPADPGYNGGAGTADRCQQRATSDLLVGAPLAAVLPLGDIQYNSASLAKIMAVYDPTWGRVKSISHPVIGNHESSGTGYFDYFNGVRAPDGPAGPRGKAWYSFDIGTWHLVALNSNCTRVDCTAGGEQERWLRADLAAHPASCTLAFWHHARYSSGHDGDNTFMQPLWDALDDAGAEIVLSGHSHDYERFAPVDRGGRIDQANGMRQFVVGTGGAFFTGGLGSRDPQSEVAQNTTFGVLFLTLHPTSYDWRFAPIAGSTFTDSGSTPCHKLLPPPPPPPPPPDVTSPVISPVKATPARFPATAEPALPATAEPALPATAKPASPVAAKPSQLGLSELTLSPARFAVGSSAAARKGGTTFRYALSEAATVSVTLLRRSVGRKVGGRCRTRTRANRRHTACVRYRRVGLLRNPGAAGRNSTHFSGWLGRRRLRSGRYRAVFLAADAAGNRSGSRRVSFMIIPRRPGPASR